MNRRIATVLAAAVVLAGAVMIVLPQHAATAARVSAATVAVLTGTLVLGAVAAIAGRAPVESALDHPPTTGVAPLDPHGLRDARRDLGRPGATGQLPPVVWDRLTRARPVGRLPDDVERLLAAPPGHGQHRDPAAVAAVVHRVLDSYERPAAPTGVRRDHD